MSPPLARAAFGRGNESVPLALTALGIPPLACFVVGLLRGAADGASLVARLAVGVALIVLSRRRDLWTAGNGESAE